MAKALPKPGTDEIPLRARIAVPIGEMLTILQAAIAGHECEVGLIAAVERVSLMLDQIINRICK